MLALKKIIPLICLLIIELDAQFFNDQNSQVGTQISTSGSNFFDNEQGGKFHKYILITTIHHNCQFFKNANFQLS